MDGVPTVIPTLHARRDDTLLLHGARTSRMLQHVGAGNPVSVAMTLIDGIVLARSVFHHSMNYRSVVLHGSGTMLETSEEKLAALEAFAEHIARGRWADARQPTKGTRPPASSRFDRPRRQIHGAPDDDGDYALPIWAGPSESACRSRHSDPRLDREIEVPPYVRRYRRVASEPLA
jgi:nitroimidazol reductase NimA-like FMN-containing flavoprotein (pyridoxamine 5'-phosphate oxidase superfamily)